ncbi:helix-turn-helix domain-containing protein [Candidatus Poribacteria bacterium]|nr:helix-turn-helix domain-containing protein [Candidatus Poribacteria bacterium]
MTFGEKVKEIRENTLKWSQAQLAEAIAVTPSYITKLETNQALPSYERCVALTTVLPNVSVEELWDLVERARAQQIQQRILKRSALLRGDVTPQPGLKELIAVRGSQVTSRRRGESTSDPNVTLTPEMLERIQEHPDMTKAVIDLLIIASDPKQFDAILTTLDAISRVVRAGGGAQ